VADEREPRRWALPSERPEGESGRVERDAYVGWRRRKIETEFEDLELRRRLLSEEAEALKERAGHRRMRALERLSPEDWDQQHQAKARGEEVATPDGGERARRDLDRATELEREADEIAQHLAAGADAAEPVEAIYNRMRGNR
jgi:hypothetical protein